MANLDILRTGSPRPGLVPALRAWVHRLHAALEDRRVERATRDSLARLSERELADIGLSRGMIEEIARGLQQKNRD